MLPRVGRELVFQWEWHWRLSTTKFAIDAINYFTIAYSTETWYSLEFWMRQRNKSFIKMHRNKRRIDDEPSIFSMYMLEMFIERWNILPHT